MSDRLRLISLGQQSSAFFQSQNASGAGLTGAAAPDGAIAAPAHVRATPTSLGVRITWSDQSANEQGYRVFRSTDGVNYETVSVLGRNSLGVLDTTVESGVNYFYKVQAFNADHISPDIAPVTVTAHITVAGSVPVIPPAAPGLPSLTAAPNGVTLTWADQSNNEDGFRVYRSADGVAFSEVADLGMNASSWTDVNVEGNTPYWYEVTAWNAGGEVAAAPADVVAAAPGPLPPSALVAAPTTRSVALTWTDNATNELGQKVYRSTDGTNFTLVTTLAPNTTKWTDTKVAFSTAYWYKVGAYNADGEYQSDALATTTLTPPPPAPTNVGATSTTNSVTLHWTDKASNETGYNIYRTTDRVNYTVVAVLDANASGWTDTSVTPNTRYWYKVGEFNSAGETQTSYLAVSTLPLPPAAPSNLAITATTISASLTWTDNSTNEAGYHVYRSTDGVNFTVVAKLGANVAAWTDTHIVANTTYMYKVGAYNAGGETLTDPASVAAQTPAPAVTPTPDPTVAPVAATQLVATTTTASVALTWTDAATNENGVNVYRSTDGTNFTVVTTLAANSTSWTDTAVSASTSYWYKLGDFNSAGETASATITATTKTPAPAAATNLAAITTTNSVALTWTDNATNEQGVKVYRSTNGSNYSLVATLGADASSWTDTTVAASTTYWYELGDFNAGGITDSSAVTATTQTPAPPSASNLAATTTANSVALTWASSAAGVQGINVYRSTDGANFSVVANLAATATSWTDASVSASTSYWYKLGDYNTVGETASATITATTRTPAPAAATNLAATTTTNSVALTWTDNATNEQGLKVYRSTDGTNFAVVATLAANSAGWTDSSAASGTTYWYKVGDYNAGGETDTAAITATTRTPAPTAATNLAGTTTPSSVALTWTDNATNEQGVKVYRSSDGVNFTLVATLGANTTSWTDSTVASSTTYWYKVGDYNAGGETDTAAVTAATPALATVSGGVTSSTKSLTTFNELVIRGTSGNDSIFVAQSNGVLTITANGQVSTYAATFGDIKIYGANGNDNITVDSSVNIASLIYGGDGNDVIHALGSAKMTVVTIGNGTNTITGNGLNTAYWVNVGDTVNASAAEIALGGVNRVNNFYQPFTTNTADPNYVSRNLYGQNLTDPTDSGVTIRRTTSSFWGTGPTKDDINQGQIADCYYIAGLSAMAYTMPQKLMNMGVDLGDGTFAVRYVRSGVTSYVRVDGDMYASGLYPGANGNQWAGIFEKAYAFYRSGANTYASLNYGSASAGLRDAGLNTTAISTSGVLQATLQNLINTQLANGKPMVANTNGGIVGGAPLIGSHSYTVIGCYLDSSGQLMIQLRNPWGYDGAGSDSNYSDGIVTISFSQLTSNISSLSYMV